MCSNCQKSKRNPQKRREKMKKENGADQGKFQMKVVTEKLHERHTYR